MAGSSGAPEPAGGGMVSGNRPRMHQIGLTRASIVFPMVAFLERIGAPIQRLMGKANLPEWVLTDPEALIPTASSVRLLAEAGRSEGIPAIGLLSGQQADIETLGLYGRLIRRSATLGEALRQVVDGYSNFSSNGRMWLESDGDDVRFCQAFVARFGKSEEAWQQANHYTLMLMLGIVRLAAGPAWRPAEVHLQTDESPALGEAESLSEARLACAQPASAIVLPRALWSAPLREPRPALEIPSHGVEAWKASAPTQDFAHSIAQVVETLAWDAYPDIHLTAEVLGMSVRTLQRQLSEVGLTHEALVGRARFATAATLLVQTDTKVLEIALDLGYSDHAHFTRAFRRWAGCSPQEFRRRRRALVDCASAS
jgi:AraC-like DNA-binding protein